MTHAAERKEDCLDAKVIHDFLRHLDPGGTFVAGLPRPIGHRFYSSLSTECHSDPRGRLCHRCAQSRELEMTDNADDPLGAASLVIMTSLLRTLSDKGVLDKEDMIRILKVASESVTQEPGGMPIADVINRLIVKIA